MKIRYSLYSLIIVLLFGFVAFAALIETKYKKQNNIKADGIIVLTGGHARLKAALHLLKQQKGKRLLISGVNKNISDATVMRALGIVNTAIVKRIDIGRLAANTAGNATEAAQWVENHKYTSVYVVTNDYHMPRSMLELKLALPQTQLIAYKVEDYSGIIDNLKHLNLNRFWLVSYEYVKYLKASVKLIAADF